MDLIIDRNYLIKIISFHGSYGQEFYLQNKKISFNPWDEKDFIYINYVGYHCKIEKLNDTHDIIWYWP